MSIGSKIAYYRKKLNITQDALAQQLEVSNQAVSKWESDQCCPDITLLPKLADIFGVSIDELFDRQASQKTEAAKLPWADDDTLRVVVYHGHTLVGESDAYSDLTFQYEGPALNIECAVNISCEDVSGDVQAAGSVSCDSVSGNVHAGGSVTCDGVEGNVQAGGSVTCDGVEGNVQAGGSVTADDIAGDVRAGGNVSCDSIDGNAEAGGNITCDEINGSATAKGNIYCDEVNTESAADVSRKEDRGDHPKNIHIHREDKAEGNSRTITLTFHKD